MSAHVRSSIYMYQLHVQACQPMLIAYYSYSNLLHIDEKAMIMDMQNSNPHPATEIRSEMSRNIKLNIKLNNRVRLGIIITIKTCQ